MMDDPELQDLLEDPVNQEVLDILRTSRPAPPPLDPHFRNYLRAKILTEARRTLPPRARRSWLPFGPMALAPAIAAVAAGFIVVLGIEVWLHNQPTKQYVAVDISHINNKTNVSTGAPIVIPFSGPVDKNAVLESVQIEPATSATKQWVGQNLVIIPDHPLAPNTSYTVTFKPQAIASPAASPNVQPTPTQAPTVAPTPSSTAGPTPSSTPAPTPSSTPAPTQPPAPAPTPVVIHFTTVPAPAPRVVPPSYKSGNVNYLFDSRLGKSGEVLSATWTSDGQLLVTRPSGRDGAGAVPSPTTTATPEGPTAPKAITDVWLMSSDGKFVRELAPGGTLPSAPTSGNLIADWHQNASDQWNLEVRDREGNLVGIVASVTAAPGRPAIWLGTDRLAYLDAGLLRVVDVAGNTKTVPATEVGQGSVAASANSSQLAVQSSDGSAGILDLSAPKPTPTKLPQGATGFAWSSNGDLAFVVQHDTGTTVYVAPAGKPATMVATSPDGQTWSDLSWAPDATSILLAGKPTGSTVDMSRLTLINADGSNALAFAASEREYAVPQWSPLGDFVLFTRSDEAGGRAFYTASVAPSQAAQSAVDIAENNVLTEVNTFMKARINGDATGARSELDQTGQNAYASGASILLSPGGSKFDRYYPASVQLAGTDTGTDKFLVTVRIFVAVSGHETSFFEEQLTLVKQDQGYLVDAVTATPAVPLGHGPTVVSVDVVPGEGGQQVRVQFDADLSGATITKDTVLIKDADGKTVSQGVTFDPERRLVTLRVKLRPGNYKLVVTTGVSDINGNALAHEYDAPLVISH